jgi:4-hydroxy-tetrahydrodipicolinate synthase
MMNKQALRGIIAPLVTPFDQNENFDEKTFRKEVQYLLNTGIHGISPGGSTGEGAVLSDEELVRMVEIIKEENKNNIPIVAGIIRNSARDAVKAGLAVKKAGATALMVTPTHYNVLVPDEDGNFDFYKRLSDEVGLSIIIYNVVPQNPIGPSLFSRMLENIEHVVGIKQSVGGIQAFYEMKLLCGDKGLIYSATDDMLYSTFDLGADGAIAAILTAFPEISVRIWDLVQEGNGAQAKELQHKLYPAWQAIKGDHFPRRIKETLHQLGREVGIARSPILEATEKEKENIKAALKYLD